MHDAPAFAQPDRETRCVLLEHTTADGDTHLDWMIERPGDPDDAGDFGDPDEHRLITFRCRVDPIARDDDDRHAPPWTGDRLPDHRARYLDYEGPISRDRGWVRRRWSTSCRIVEESGRSLIVIVRHPTTAVERRLVLTRGVCDRWSLSGP